MGAQFPEIVVSILKNKWLYVALVVVAVILFAAFGLGKKDKTQYFTAKIEKGDIREVVEATGTINAVTTVQVGSQVSGTISKLFVDFNSHVKAGQMLAKIDPSLFEGTLLQAQADLANARANAAASKANLAKAIAAETQAEADYKRYQGLASQGIISQQQLDVAKATADSDVAAVSAAKAQVTQADAQVKQKEAAVTVAQTNLNYTNIHSPIDGVVVNRTVDVGQTVAASLQAPNLFQIAQDLTKMQVYTSTDESDVGMIKVGQPVTFKVDAFPKDTFHGQVAQIRLNPTTVQNVVTYNTVVTFDNPDMKLFPGMTAYVTIPVATARETLKVPNGALRYTPEMPADQLRALLKENGIELGNGRRQMAQGEGGAQQGGGGQPPERGQQAGGRGATAGRGGFGGQGGAGGRQFGQGGQTPGGGMGGSRGPSDVAIIWKLMPDKSVKPVQVKIGITDHTVTQLVSVLKGQLNEGDEVVIGAASARAGGNRPPGMGGPGGPRR